ncbi:MAG: bifunctional helix-turn-helix transcriptional regulator/GNAT family N-acetyltransferase [bacterium]
MTSKKNIPADESVRAVRRFNRFYTRELGLLDKSHLESPFSLAAVRVMYELDHWSESHDALPTATELGGELGLDAGYLSRILADLRRRGLLKRTPSPADARQSLLRLTGKGRSTFADLDRRATDEVTARLAPLSAARQQHLIASIEAVRLHLEAPLSHATAVTLRAPGFGDLGWILMRHGELYAREYGLNARFEALVAKIIGDFAESHDPRRERLWIAELDGVRVGCVLLVAHPDRAGVAKLRILLVEPWARGHGAGRLLVDACTTFARESGYHTITLWTQSVLASARRIYQAAGYVLVNEAAHHELGRALTEQTWELKL